MPQWTIVGTGHFNLLSIFAPKLLPTKIIHSSSESRGASNVPLKIKKKLVKSVNDPNEPLSGKYVESSHIVYRWWTTPRMGVLTSCKYPKLPPVN